MRCSEIEPGPAFGEFKCAITGGTVDERCGDLTLHEDDPCIARLAQQYAAGTLSLEEVTSEREREAIVMTARNQGEGKGASDRGVGVGEMSGTQLEALYARVRAEKRLRRAGKKHQPRLLALKAKLESEIAVGQTILAETNEALALMKAGKVHPNLLILLKRAPRIPRGKAARSAEE